MDDVRRRDKAEGLHLHAAPITSFSATMANSSASRSATEAERALAARRGDVARRTYRVVEDIAFDAWADRWLAGLTGKANTRRVYAVSLAYAKEAFGRTKVCDLTPADVRRYLDLIRKTPANRRKSKVSAAPTAEIAPATLAKHLRQLGACLQAAVSEGYANENPVRRLHKTARPKVAKSRPAYYTDEELARLWPELTFQPAMLALCKTAVGTGLRFGELAALRWTDVDLLNRELHVARTFVEGVGEQSTKSDEPRTVDLTPPAAAVLERWFAESGVARGSYSLVRKAATSRRATSRSVCFIRRSGALGSRVSASAAGAETSTRSAIPSPASHWKAVPKSFGSGARWATLRSRLTSTRTAPGHGLLRSPRLNASPTRCAVKERLPRSLCPGKTGN